MGRNYNLDPGYVTIPEAANIVKRMLGIVKKEDKTHYNTILRGAKKGWFGGKTHGKRMYQVCRKEIIQYAEELLKAERFNLFNFDISTDSKEIERISKLSEIDQETARKLYYYLKTLRFHDIISADIYQNAEKMLMLRMDMSRITYV